MELQSLTVEQVDQTPAIEFPFAQVAKDQIVPADILWRDFKLDCAA